MKLSIHAHILTHFTFKFIRNQSLNILYRIVFHTVLQQVKFVYNFLTYLLVRLVNIINKLYACVQIRKLRVHANTGKYINVIY